MVYERAHQLAAELKESEEYRLYCHAKERAFSNETTRNLIEEYQKIQTRVELSGLKKQEYYLQAILNQKLYAVGNVRTFDAMWKRIEEVDEHLQSIERVDELDPEILHTLETIVEILDSHDRRTEIMKDKD